jgi:antitoxin HicB
VKNRHFGSTLSSFLDEEGIREEVDLRAKKKILADQILAKMQQDRVTRTNLAKRMHTSRTVINRLLDPSDTSFTFGTLAKASLALDLDLLVSLETKATESPQSRK